MARQERVLTAGSKSRRLAFNERLSHRPLQPVRHATARIGGTFRSEPRPNNGRA